MCACQAIDMQEKKNLGKGTAFIYKKIREKSSFIENDRLFYNDLNIIEKIIDSDNFLFQLENEIGKIDF